MARFPSPADARAAIEALQSAGIDGDDITLLSPFPQESRRSSELADGRIARYLARRVVVGVLVGVAGGLGVGALAGLVLVGATSPPTPLAEVVALAIAGIIIGAPLGAYIGFERAGTLSDAWSTTFDELEPGAIWVGVKLHDANQQERARRTLARQHPAELREL